MTNAGRRSARDTEEEQTAGRIGRAAAQDGRQPSGIRRFFLTREEEADRITGNRAEGHSGRPPQSAAALLAGMQCARRPAEGKDCDMDQGNMRTAAFPERKQIGGTK